MPDILHCVGIDARPERVFQALTTLEGLRGWWVADCTGDADAGGTIDFGFCRMRVIDAEPDELVRWHCLEGPQEWVYTEVTFRLEWKEGQTFVLFAHTDWKEPVEFMHHCSTKWAYFILGLKAALEGGKGTPYPADMPISSWG